MTPAQFRSLMSFAYTLAFSHGAKWMMSDAPASSCAQTISDKLDEDLPLLISKANFDSLTFDDRHNLDDLTNERDSETLTASGRTESEILNILKPLD